MKSIYRPRRARPGTTLIEVVLGLVVLSTLVVSVTIARSRFARQWADADRRLRLVHAGDELIAGWLAAAPQPVPIGHGAVAAEPGATWRTSLIPDRGAATLNTVIVRLDLFGPHADSPAVSIDFLQRLSSAPAPQPGGPP